MREIPFYVPSIDKEERALINEVLSLKGASKIEELEDLVTEYIGCKYAVSTSSWSGAMHLSMFALNLKRGDKILCSVNAFPTVAEAVRHFDAEPIFVDIDSEDFNISPLKLKELWKERLKREFASGAVSSIASPVMKREKAKEFWLMVNTELILYGQTEPDAKLTVGDQPVNLKPDGSFSLRFFLPDGKHIIPVVATSSDGEQVRNITPIVSKETR